MGIYNLLSKANTATESTYQKENSFTKCFSTEDDLIILSLFLILPMVWWISKYEIRRIEVILANENEEIVFFNLQNQYESIAYAKYSFNPDKLFLSHRVVRVFCFSHEKNHILERRDFNLN